MKPESHILKTIGEELEKASGKPVKQDNVRAALSQLSDEDLIFLNDCIEKYKEDPKQLSEEDRRAIEKYIIF